MLDGEQIDLDVTSPAAAAALLQVAREINGRLELGECLQRVCTITRTTLRADRSNIVLWSERKHGFIAAADVGTPADLSAQFKGKTFSMSGSAYLDELASGDVVVIDRHTPASMAQRLLAGLHLATQIIAPLTGQRGFIGVLLVSYERPVQVTREQRDLVHGIAQQAAVAIEAARLFTNTQKAAAFRAALSDLTLDLSREADPGRMRERVCHAAQSMFAAHGAVLAEVRADDLSLRATSGTGAAVGARRLPLTGCGIVSAVLRDGRPRCVNRLGHGAGPADALLDLLPGRAALAIPLLPEHAAAGVLLVVDADEPDRFGTVHADEATIVSATVTAWLDNRELLAALAAERAKLAERSLRLQEANAALTLRSEQVRSANRALEEMIYIASHDLRAPLINLDGFTRELTAALQHMRGSLNGSTDAALQDADEAAHFIHNATTRLSALVQGLLDVSRCGTRPLGYEQVDVQALVRTILDTQQFVISSAGIDVQVGALPAVTADPVGLGQVLANLIDNAIKYMGTAPVRRLEIGYSGGAEHRFFVRDSGPGIGAADHERIFRVFQRGSRPPAAPGEGIGLAVVRKIMERHGGSVVLESAPGHGATFWVTLPLQPPSAAVDPTAN